MTADASRSCLGLAACVGSAIRQIVDARVLLTATAPPALPGRSVSDGSLAPPLGTITRFLRSACRYCDLPKHRLDLRRQPIAARHGGFTRRDIVFEHEVMDRLVERESRQPAA